MPERTLVLPAPTHRRRKVTAWNHAADVAARMGSGVTLAALLTVTGAVVGLVDGDHAPVDTAQVVTYQIVGN